MAYRIGSSTGNFTAAGTWLTCDATSNNDSEAANTALTTAFVASTAFTPGAITAAGVAIKIASRAAGSPSNVITVRLANAGVDVAGTDVSMNVSDINVCTSTAITANEGGWYFFRFNVAGTPTPVLLLAATAYTLQIKLDSTSTAVNVYSASGSNWSRMVATSTTGAPAAGDNLHIMGDNLAAGTSNSYTVTMDNTATTSFGTIATQSLTVNKGGTLTCGTAASTAYVLKVKGKTRVFSGGTLNFGTSGTRIPSTSSLTYTYDCTAAVDSGIEIANGGTCNRYGAVKNTYTLLTTDKAATNTVISGLTSTTGWLAGDTLMFESSTTTGSQVETKVILTVDSATQVTLTAGLTNAHSGTAPTAIYVSNLTKNVRFVGGSATLVGFEYIANTATYNYDQVEWTAIGNTSTNTRGIDVTTTTGSGTINNCSIHDGTVFTSIGINVSGAASNNYTITNNVVYNMNTGGIGNAATTGSNWSISGNLIANIQSGGSNGGLNLQALKGTVTNNVASSCNSGGNIVIGASDIVGTFSGNSAHSGSSSLSNVLITGAVAGGTLSTITAWRASSSGASGILVQGPCFAIIDSAVLFGNSSAGLTLSSGGYIEFNNSTFNAGVTNTQPVGFSVSSGAFRANNNSFGGTTTHSTGDINVSASANVYGWLNNNLLASATELANQTNMSPDSFIGSEKHDQTSGNNRSFRKYGLISIDTTIFDKTPSLRMTPNNATNKLNFARGVILVGVKSGQAITVSMKVRESVVGDGAAYNGARVRLIVRRNYSLGITSDTVLATATASSTGAFQTITGTTPTASEDGALEFTVDCDGTTGWINADTFTSTPNNDSTGLQFWKDGVPLVYGNNSAASSGFIIM